MRGAGRYAENARREDAAAKHTYRLPAPSAHAISADCQKCLDAGCNRCFTKPIKRDKLLAMVAKFSRQPTA